MGIILLEKKIFQYNESDEYWERFLYKASIGSYKAALMVREFEYKILNDLTGIDVYEENVENEFKINNLKIDNPFSNPEEMMNSLTESNCVNDSITKINLRFHETNFYQSLWEKGRRVNEYELLNDAILVIFNNFESKRYLELADKLFDEDPDYNSLECVVCMIYLTVIFSLKLKNG